jgi:hypothetical protein
MAGDAPRRPYRAPTEAADATVTLSDGSELRGRLHLHADASAEGGFESVQHLLDEGESFIAVTLDSGRVALVGKRHVVEVRCGLPVGEGLPGTTAHRLEVGLSTGAAREGTAVRSAPPAHGRAIDLLNASDFIRLETDDGFVYVNTAHIRLAYPGD